MFIANLSRMCRKVCACTKVITFCCGTLSTKTVVVVHVELSSRLVVHTQPLFHYFHLPFPHPKTITVITIINIFPPLPQSSERKGI